MEHSAFSTSLTGSDLASLHDLAEAGLAADAPGGRNVLVLLPSAMVGGAERVAFNFVTALLDRGDGVTVYTMTRGPGPLWPTLKQRSGFTHLVSHASSEKRGLADFVLRLAQLRAGGPYDLIYTSHVHINALAALTLRLGLLKAERFVSRESTRIFDRYSGRKSWVYRLAYRCYGPQDKLIFQTEEMRDSLESAVHLPPGLPRTIVPNPVNLANVDAALARSDLPQAVPGVYRMVLCGRLIALKRIDLLLAALSHLDWNRQWQLDILGQGPLLQELSLEAERRGLSGKVRFHGTVAHPYAWFAQADLGLLCSSIEGFPNVLLEMMACGTKQIIATPCTPSVRQLPDIAILEEPMPETLAAMIARSMDSRPDMSRRYRNHVERAHSIHGFVRAVFGEED